MYTIQGDLDKQRRTTVKTVQQNPNINIPTNCEQNCTVFYKQSKCEDGNGQKFYWSINSTLTD